MSVLTLLGVLRRIWPYVAGLALIIAACFWAYHRGAAHVQGQWDAARARGMAVVAAKNIELQRAKDSAEAANAERARLFDLVNRPIQNEVTAYVKTPAATVRCADAAGVSIGDRAIAAANAALAAH